MPNLRSLTLRLFAAISLAFALPAAAQTPALPLEVRIDMSILALEESILAQDSAAILANIAALRALDPSAGDGELLFYEAEAAIAQNDLDRAEPALVRFLSEVGAESVNYQPALKLMLALPAKRAAADAAARKVEADRKAAEERENARKLAAETARKMEERAAAQRAQEAAKRQQEQRYIDAERSLGLSQDDIRHIRFILAQRARDYRMPPLSTVFTAEDRKRIADYNRFRQIQKPVVGMQYLDSVASRQILTTKFIPETYLNGRYGSTNTRVTNLGGDWVNYTNSAKDRCYIESAATNWSTNEIFQRPVMNFSSKTTWSSRSLALDMVTPNPFRAKAPVYAIVDGVRFDLQVDENGVIKPVRTGDNLVSSDVIKAIRASKDSIRIHGTGAMTGRPLAVTFSGWGFTAAFRKMMTDCNRPGLASWIE